MGRSFSYSYFWTPAGSGDNLLPHGAAIAWIPLANVGYLGVTLFFLISGYVISLTLVRTNALRDFAVKRIARLWPTLVFCRTLTFLVAQLFGPNELKVGTVEWLISIFSVPPQHIGHFFGHSDWRWVDGAY